MDYSELNAAVAWLRNAIEAGEKALRQDPPPELRREYELALAHKRELLARLDQLKSSVDQDHHHSAGGGGAQVAA